MRVHEVSLEDAKAWSATYLQARRDVWARTNARLCALFGTEPAQRRLLVNRPDSELVPESAAEYEAAANGHRLL